MVKNPPANAGNTRDTVSIPGSGRSPGERNGSLLQYSCLEYPHGQKSLEDYSPWDCKELDMNIRDLPGFKTLEEIMNLESFMLI